MAYPVGTAVDAVLEVGIFHGRGGPMVSAHCRALRPANLGNAPARQAAAMEALRAGTALPPEQAAAFLPDRAAIATVYRLVRAGGVPAGDLQPLFAQLGPDHTGRTLAALDALAELGLIEEREGCWRPAAVTAKKNLDDAPVLQTLRALAAGQNPQP